MLCFARRSSMSKEQNAIERASEKFHIKNKERNPILDRLVKPNGKHIRWCSAHEITTPFKVSITFPLKDKSCYEKF